MHQMLKGPAVAAGGGFRRLKLNLDWLENLWTFKCLSLSLLFSAQQVGLSQTSGSSSLSSCRLLAFFLQPFMQVKLSCVASSGGPEALAGPPTLQSKPMNSWNQRNGVEETRQKKGLSELKEKIGAIRVSKSRNRQTVNTQQNDYSKKQMRNRKCCANTSTKLELVQKSDRERNKLQKILRHKKYCRNRLQVQNYSGRNSRALSVLRYCCLRNWNLRIRMSCVVGSKLWPWKMDQGTHRRLAARVLVG